MTDNLQKLIAKNKFTGFEVAVKKHDGHYEIMWEDSEPVYMSPCVFHHFWEIKDEQIAGGESE